MKQIGIIGLLFCIILAGCAASGPKPETVEKPSKPEKIEKVERPETTTPTTPTDKNDPYAGRSLPYNMSFGMSKAEVTAILTKITGGSPKNQNGNLIWSGIAVQKPRIVVVLAAIFNGGKLSAFEIAQFGKKSDETFKQIDAGFNRKLNELKAKFTLRDTQETDLFKAALFETREGHFLILTFQDDEKKGLYITGLRHVDKLPKK